MDTKLATTTYRLQQWATVFQARTDSGLTIDEYCKQNGISQNAYYYWLRKTRTAALEASHTVFVELDAPSSETTEKVSDPERPFQPQLTVVKNGFLIGVDAHTPRELFSLALEAVSHAE